MYSHWSILEHGDTSSEVGDHLGAQFSLLCDSGGELARVLLNIHDVRFEFGSELLEVLHDGALDSLGEVGMMVGDQASLLPL